MKIAITPGPLWEPACEACGIQWQAVPQPASIGDSYGLDLAARAKLGQLASEMLAREPVQYLLDSGGAGLLFVEGPGGFSELKLVHEVREVPLVSHLTDSIVSLTQGLPWDVLWQCLGSKRWVKAVADPSHAAELRAFGLPNVTTLQHAALEFPYPRRPLDEETIDADVAFVGDSSASLFSTNDGTGGNQQEWDSAKSWDPTADFFTIYHEIEKRGQRPEADESAESIKAKATAYFNSKLRWSAGLCRYHRDRFVSALAREFGDSLRVQGRGWGWLDGGRIVGRSSSIEEHVNRARTAAVNVCVWDGLSESTISSRHFEIAAAGGFLLCYHHPKVNEIFKIGQECDTFSNEKELIDKCRYYLAHPEERVAMAMAGQRRVLGEHLLRNRLQTVLEWHETAKREVALLQSKNAGSSPDAPGETEQGSDDSGKLMVLLNPGQFTRKYLLDMASASSRLGIRTGTYDLTNVFALMRQGGGIDPNPFAEQLRRERVTAVISSGPNGIWEWPCAFRPDGRVSPFFEQLNIPHIVWWTDHPQWNHEKVALREDLQPVLNSPNIHHFVKSEMAAQELKDLLGWPNCYGLPVAEDPETLAPVETVEAEFDIVAVVGSMPYPFAALEPFVEQDRPDMDEMMDVMAIEVRTRLSDLWAKDCPEDVRPALMALGEEWVDAKRSDPYTGSYWWFRRLESSHPQAACWLRENPRSYFEAVDHLWQINNWQRTFTLRYLSRFFKVGVVGSNWSSVGMGQTPRIDHEDQPAAYARGKIAINILQGNDEEGVSHKPFQIAASGVPLLHNNRRGLSDLFVPGEELEVFESPVEARGVVESLLADDERRIAMARAARERLCRDHTWEVRLPDLLKVTGVQFPGLSNTPSKAFKATDTCPANEDAALLV